MSRQLAAATLAIAISSTAIADPCATEKEITAISAYQYWYSFGLTIGACDRKYGTTLKNDFASGLAKLNDDPITNGGLQSYAKKLGVTVQQLQVKLESAVELLRASTFPETFPAKENCLSISTQLQIPRLKAGVADAGRIDVRFARQQGNICPP